jgi:hypothetical protein
MSAARKIGLGLLVLAVVVANAKDVARHIRISTM